MSSQRTESYVVETHNDTTTQLEQGNQEESHLGGQSGNYNITHNLTFLNLKYTSCSVLFN